MKESLQVNKVNIPRHSHPPSYRRGDSLPSMDTCLSGIDALLAGLCLSGNQSTDLDKQLINSNESRALLQEMLEGAQ